MIQRIDIVDDVTRFFKELNQESLAFCPDTPFNDYINLVTHEATYTDEEAQVRNELLNQAFEVCDRDGVDIHELAMEIFSLDFDNLMAEE
jgi:hypothetical protein